MATSSSGGRSRSTRREPPTNPEVNVDLVILIDISDAFSLEIQVKPSYKKKDALLYKNTNHVVRLCYVIISDFFYQNIEYLTRKNCSRNPYCVK